MTPAAYPAPVLVGVIAFEFMVAGEDICLNRHPWWGPPKSGYDDTCSGLIDEWMHPRLP